MFFQPVKSIVESASSVGTVISPILVILSLTVAVITKDLRIVSWLVITVFKLIESVLKLSIVVSDSLSIFRIILTASSKYAISPCPVQSPAAL